MKSGAINTNKHRCVTSYFFKYSYSSYTTCGLLVCACANANINIFWMNFPAYVSTCIYSMCVPRSQQMCGELYSTLCYIGKPEKFPFQRGGNLEKRAQVLSQQETVYTLLLSTLSPHLTVTLLGVTTFTWPPWVYWTKGTKWGMCAYIVHTHKNIQSVQITL